MKLKRTLNKNATDQDKIIKEFNKVRSNYLRDLNKLRTKYKKDFTNLLAEYEPNV